jgi:hypothetical protein
VAEGVIGILPLVCQSLDQALLLVDALFRSSNVLIGFGNIRNHIKSGPGVGRLPKLPRMHTLAHRLRRDVAMSTLDPELNDFGAHSRFTPGKLAKDEPLHQLIPLAEFAFNTAGRENAATMNAGLAYVDTWRVAARSNRSAQQRRRAKLQALTTVLPTQRRPARSRKNSRREGSRPQALRGLVGLRLRHQTLPARPGYRVRVRCCAPAAGRDDRRSSWCTRIAEATVKRAI